MVYLSLGSNIGKREAHLLKAATLIGEYGMVTARSAVYETAAWGKTDQSPFLNQVLGFRTRIPPTVLMQCLLAVERSMGRIRTEKYGPRIIDIDILFYDEQVIDTPQLTIPHPSLHLRRFVLAPLNELAPDLVHPVLHRTIAELLQECDDGLDVRPLSREGHQKP